MQIGPFPSRDIEGISKILDDLKVPYKIIQDSDKLKENIETHAFNASMGPSYAAGRFDGAIIYFEVSDGDLDKIGDSLEKYGISLQPFLAHLDGAEYFCLKCKHKSDHSGVCPTHALPLLEFSEWVRVKRAKTEKVERVVLGIIVGALLIAMIVSLFTGGSTALFQNFSH